MAGSPENRDTLKGIKTGWQSQRLCWNSVECAAALSRIQFPPALPETLLRLDLMLSRRAPDLHGVSNLIRSDLSLALRVLNLIGQSGERDQSSLELNQAIIELGRSGLGDLFLNTSRVRSGLRVDLDLREYRRFSHRARLRGLIAEEISAMQPNISSDQAFFVGMLYRLGELPTVLNWDVPSLHEREPDEIARVLVNLWDLPSAVNIWTCGDPCQPFPLPARELATAADSWMQSLEQILGQDCCTPAVFRGPWRH